MKSLTQHINEALKPGRAWSGKLKNLDNLMSWMYDEDILSKGEKKKKDSLFRQYYRWYNDGDLPSLARSLGISKGMVYNGSWAEGKIEEALEEKVTEFIKSILTKYAGKIDRQQFNIDTYIEEVQSVIRAIDDNDVSTTFKYFNEQVNITDTTYQKLVNDAEKQFAEFKNIYVDWSSKLELKNEKELNDYDLKAFREYSRYVPNFMMETLPGKLGIKEVPRNVKSSWDDTIIAFKHVKLFLLNAVNAAKELKKITK